MILSLLWACSAPPPAAPSVTAEPPALAAAPAPLQAPTAAPSAPLTLGPFVLRELDERELTGVCEPSAAVAIEGGFVLAEDDSAKSLVRFTSGATSGESFKHKEAGDTLKLKDLEAAAGDGARSWWLTSHSKADPERSRLALASKDGAALQGCVSLAGLNAPGALQAVLDRSADTCAGCAVAVGYEALGSKEGGLDFEALALSDGALYLGLRGPLTADGRALVLRVEEAAAEAALKPCGANAGLDLSLLSAHGLDLGGARGLRAMTELPPGQGLLAVAGPVGGQGDFSLVHWSPTDAAQVQGALPQVPLPAPEGSSPEALLIELTENGTALTVLFDAGQRVEAQHKADTTVDGQARSAGCDCEALAEGRCERDGALLPGSSATAPMRRYALSPAVATPAPQ